ncbi:ATP-binding protein [Amycolatopsis sp. NPDC005003]
MFAFVFERTDLARARRDAIFPAPPGRTPDHDLRSREEVWLSPPAFRPGNEYAGSAGNVVQAGHVHGDVHVRTSAPDGARAPVPRQFHGMVRHFVGRDTELDRFRRIMEQRTIEGLLATPTIIVSGAPGVGKTALLVHWVRQVMDEFPDGVLFVDLHGYGPVTPKNTSQVLDGFLRALGISPQLIPAELEDRSALFRSMLARRRMIVILDNADTSERIRPLLPGSEFALTLITSRSILSGLVARDGADRMTLDTLSPAEADGLLRQIIGIDRVGAEPAAAAELARLCAYLPLALRIVAERISAQPHARLADLVADLTSEARRLDILSPEDDEQTAVRAVFSWSYRALTPPVARLFRLLGSSPCPDLGVPAISALAGLGSTETRNLLFSLVSLHLLTEHQRGRYKFHDLLRVYAAERAAEDEPETERAAALDRLLTWYLDAAEAADRRVAPGAASIAPVRDLAVEFGSYDEALAWFEAEKDNLRVMIRWALESGRPDIAAYIPLEMWGFFNIRKYWTDWLSCNEIGLAAVRQSGNRRAEAWLLTSQGTAYRNLRRRSEAIECHRGALDKFDMITDPAGVGYGRQNLANVQADGREFDAAMVNFGLALDAFGQVGDSRDKYRGEGVTFNSMAVAYNNMGRHLNALECAQEAITRWTELDSGHGLAFGHHSIGTAYAGLERFDEAVTSFDAALRIRRQINDRHGEGRSLLALGVVQQALNRMADARESVRSAMEIFTVLNAPEAEDAAALLARLEQSGS